jgi:hypothetical protein
VLGLWRVRRGRRVRRDHGRHHEQGVEPAFCRRTDLNGPRN